MAVIRDIAEKAGVSTAAVSIALHGGSGRTRVSADKTKLIRKIANELNYRLNSAARMMSSSRTGQIGVLLRNSPDAPMCNPANFETVLGIGEELSNMGYVQMLVPLAGIKKGIKGSNRIFSEQLLDGIIVMDAHQSSLYSFVKRNFQHFIFLETNSWYRTSCLRRDDRKTGMLAAKAMIDSGYRRIIYLGPERSSSMHFSVLERHEGVLETASGRSVDFDSMEISDDKDIELLKKEIKADTGFICYDTLLARKLHMMMSESGLLPPRDYGLVCCDDTHETGLVFPSLSRIGNDRYETGRLAARMLVDSIQDVKPMTSRLIDVSFIKGNTIK